ncbi:ABC transporter substrate-binding protein [Desulfovibrio ferrophilus]|uniref:Periplasmic binding protein n=1 Tax=Desulfovibrio ferrophilus TaxID=241368 RepID=A0A2Z6AX10_9BACT|nr:ABC transporter substrate-binding protein [Desulfovibrio ferrophilus]BBD07745.1 periplasmic binding protein [Desulfovibrio ferrophilus]
MLLLGTPAFADPVEIVDGQGSVIRLEAPARRVICLYGAFSELFVSMGQNDRLVARTKADASIPTLAHLPSVGTHMRPSLELIVGLRPDVVIQLAGRKEAVQTVDALRKHGLNVAVFNPTTFGELFEAIKAMGTLVGAPGSAQLLIDNMTLRLSALANCLEKLKDRPRIFFEVRSPSLLAAGRGGIVNDIIERAGGDNAVVSERKIVRLGEEGLIGLDPDVYVVQEGAMNRNPLPLIKRPLYSQLRAVKQNRTLLVDESLFSRPGPRAVDAVEHLAGFLHPEIMCNQKDPQ